MPVTILTLSIRLIHFLFPSEKKSQLKADQGYFGWSKADLLYMSGLWITTNPRAVYWKNIKVDDLRGLSANKIGSNEFLDKIF